MSRLNNSWAQRFAIAMLVCGAIPVQALAQQNDGFAIEEIVVTAQKRDERLMDVPIAISAFTNDAMIDAGAAQLADFLQTAPGVGIVRQPVRNPEYPDSRRQLGIRQRGRWLLSRRVAILTDRQRAGSRRQDLRSRTHRDSAWPPGNALWRRLHRRHDSDTDLRARSRRVLRQR